MFEYQRIGTVAHEPVESVNFVSRGAIHLRPEGRSFLAVSGINLIYADWNVICVRRHTLPAFSGGGLTFCRLRSYRQVTVRNLADDYSRYA